MNHDDWFEKETAKMHRQMTRFIMIAVALKIAILAGLSCGVVYGYQYVIAPSFGLPKLGAE